MTYPGGKAGAGVYQTIINLMPPHNVYIEPFLGGGAIMRMKRPARLNIGVDLVDPSELPMQSCIGRNGEAAGKPANNGDGGPWLWLPDLSPDSATAAAVAENSDARSLHAENGEARQHASTVLTMPDPHAKTSDRARTDPLATDGDGVPAEFRFIQGDGIAFLKRYRFTGSELVYCDPPYVRSTRTPRRLYQHEMTDVDHRRLLRVLQELKCRVIVSGYWSAMYATALADWNTTTFQAMTRGGRPATEWLWYNFPRPLELHDYRYLGNNFRERERIKRKTLRWTRRLERMPELEKRALLWAIQADGATRRPGKTLH